jgi:hypothetical protein
MTPHYFRDIVAKTLFLSFTMHDIMCKFNHTAAKLSLVHHVPQEPAPASSITTTKHTSRNDDWLLPVGMTMVQQARQATADEHPDVEWRTWHLCAHVRTRSEDSRPIRFDVEQHMWLQDLQQLWQDQWIPNIAARIIIVEPTPPKAPYEHHVGHILIIQGDLPHHAPVLVTTVFASAIGRRHSHLACFLPQFFEPMRLLQMLRLDRICQHRGCHVSLHGHQIPPQGLGQVADGDHIQVHVPARDVLGTSLVQTQVQRRHEIAMRADHRTDPCSASCQDALELPQVHGDTEQFVFDPETPALVPGRITMTGQSEFSQDLYNQWYQSAFTWEGKYHHA